MGSIKRDRSIRNYKVEQIDPSWSLCRTKKRGKYIDRPGQIHSIDKSRFHKDRLISNYRSIDPWKHRYESWYK